MVHETFDKTELILLLISSHRIFKVHTISGFYICRILMVSDRKTLFPQVNEDSPMLHSTGLSGWRSSKESPVDCVMFTQKFLLSSYPMNVLLNSNIEPLLVDYGFTPLFGSTHAATQALTLYKAPEAMQSHQVSMGNGYPQGLSHLFFSPLPLFSLRRGRF